MRTRFQCPDCKAILSASSDKAGSQVICPTCKIRVIVPTAAKLGIFLEEYEGPAEKSRPNQPPPVSSAAPIEKDWRNEPPLLLAEVVSASDDRNEKPDDEVDEVEDGGDYRPGPRRPPRSVPHISLVPATLLVLAEAIFGAAALAVSVIAFLRTRS